MAMQAQSSSALTELGNRFADYMPTLTAGMVVVGLGIAVGWLAKRAIIRILVMLRLDRLSGRSSWRAAFGKGDVRAALYDLVGTIVMVLVVLLFLENALQIWGLTVLSASINRLIIYLPNLALVGLIVGVGMFFANTAATQIEDALEEEGAPRPRLVAKIAKAALLAMVAALALWQLDFAREIILSAFLIGFGAVGIAFALGAGLGSAKAIQKGWEKLFERDKDP